MTAAVIEINCSYKEIKMFKGLWKWIKKNIHAGMMISGKGFANDWIFCSKVLSRGFLAGQKT
ncbi:hypothetical protein LIT25_22045 [Bacillus sp. F19]|nr:hypothetical protein LIT25_22045 [Bacillus sp. F19]